MKNTESELYDIVLEYLTQKNVTITQYHCFGYTLCAEKFMVKDTKTNEDIFSVTKTTTKTGTNLYEYSMDYKNQLQNVSNEFAHKIFDHIKTIMDKRCSEQISGKKKLNIIQRLILKLQNVR